MPILQEDLQQLAELTKALTEENSGYVKDVRLINKFGEEKWYRIHINSIWDKENYGVMLSIVGRMVSIDKMKREIGLWKRQAESDALTKLGNRAYGERLLRAGIEKIGLEADVQVPLSISVGVSFYPVDGTDDAVLLYKADKALYEAKKRGKNNCVIYSKELENEPFMSQITAAESE